jgi:rifampicin phosphotransferase
MFGVGLGRAKGTMGSQHSVARSAVARSGSGRLDAAGRRPDVVGLDDASARSAELAGGKAASLAVVVAAGMPVLPGCVITTAGTAAIEGGDRTPAERAAAWAAGCGSDTVVVRSSSTVEDLGSTSMAGRYTTVAGVDAGDRNELAAAIGTVIESRRDAACGTDIDPDAPFAVLIQPEAHPEISGVLFGVDPVTGREDHMVVSATEGSPESIVSGTAPGTTYVIDRAGEPVRSPRNRLVSRRRLRSLARLGRDLEELFGEPQDVEWAVEHGELLVLQSRPVTTERRGVPTGPVLGPGPLAETFGLPLSRLESDLWIEPLRQALAETLRFAGSASDAEIAASPVATTIDGRVAIDLELAGEIAPDGFWRRLAVRRRLRRLRAAWRVGRTRAALPDIATDLVRRLDRDLREVPDPGELEDLQLEGVLDRIGAALASVHAHEILLGSLVGPDEPRLTGTSVGLRILQRARDEGLSDAEIVQRHPIVLGLAPPRITPELELPRSIALPAWSPPDGAGPAVIRESLRVRVRWVHELSRRCALEIGARLVERGTIDDVAAIRHLPLIDLQMILAGQASPLFGAPESPEGDPLPSRFRLGTRGRPIPVRRGGSSGTGAGGGRGEGPVVMDPVSVEGGEVLVVAALAPELAAHLPRLGGLVAETGSVLSHLAILAREAGVPTVVSCHAVRERLEPGMRCHRRRRRRNGGVRGGARMIGRLAWVIAWLAAAAAGAYVFIYQYRWEWNRAIFMAVVFVALEAALGLALVIRKLNRAVDRVDASQEDRVLSTIRETAPQRDYFAWLSPERDRFNVFLTMLVSGGVLVSAGVWVVDRIAGATVRPAFERDLARRLQRVAYPGGGLVPTPSEVGAQPPPFGDYEELRLLIGPADPS